MGPPGPSTRTLQAGRWSWAYQQYPSSLVQAALGLRVVPGGCQLERDRSGRTLSEWCDWEAHDIENPQIISHKKIFFSGTCLNSCVNVQAVCGVVNACSFLSLGENSSHPTAGISNSSSWSALAVRNGWRVQSLFHTSWFPVPSIVKS